MYEFELREMPRLPAIFGVASCKHDEIGPTIGRVFATVAKSAAEQGAQMAGPPFARYTDWTDESCTIEAGMPIASPGQDHGEIRAGELGGGLVAHTIYHGPYDQLTQVHDAAMQWIAVNGKEVGGNPWETYLTDPEKNPDPATWQTEICWPVK